MVLRVREKAPFFLLKGCVYVFRRCRGKWGFCWFWWLHVLASPWLAYAVRPIPISTRTGPHGKQPTVIWNEFQNHSVQYIKKNYKAKFLSWNSSKAHGQNAHVIDNCKQNLRPVTRHRNAPVSTQGLFFYAKRHERRVSNIHSICQRGHPKMTSAKGRGEGSGLLILNADVIFRRLLCSKKKNLLEDHFKI